MDGELDLSVLEPLEHSVLEVARNGRPMAGISVLEPLEHSVPEVTLVWGDCSFIRMTVSIIREDVVVRPFPGREFHDRSGFSPGELYPRRDVHG